MDSTERKARLRGLRVDSVARIRAANLRFDEDAGIVEITGANEQGKSTLIEAISVALGGSSLERPITAGADRGDVEVTLELEEGPGLEPTEIKARRIWTTRDGQVRERLEVSTQAGKLSSPQAVLDRLLTRIAVDPFAWLDLARAGLPGRRRMVAQLLEGLGVKVSDAIQSVADEHGVRIERDAGASEAIAAVDTAVRSKRLAIGQQLEQARARLVMPEGPREQPVDTRELVGELENLQGHRRSVELWQQTVEKGERAVVDLRAKLVELERQLAVNRESAAKALAASGHEHLTAIDQAIAEAKETIAKASAGASRASAWAAYDEAKASAASLQERHAALDKDVKALAQARIDLLAQADLPEGLELAEDGTLSLAGAPFPSQASGAQQILTALAVCAATRPMLRLLRVRDGNRLDSRHRAALEAWLEEHDYLALVELVDESGEVGIVVEDGEIVADNRPKGRRKGKQ